MSTVLASAADARYGYWLLNLLGSVARNSPDVFDRIVVYDLGLNRLQRALVRRVRGVETRTVPPFCPHWRQCYSWKPWAWTHTDAEPLLWLDAGTTVLRSLAGVVEQIRERGYFVVSQDNKLRDIVPGDYYALYDLPEQAGSRDYVAAGIIGFRTDGELYRRVIFPTYEDVLRGRNLGFSAGEAPRLNFGLNRLETLVVRSCPRFRHDQTLLNIHLLAAMPDAVVDDLDRYAGWRSRRDHPEQVIWSHRRRGDFAYLPRVPYDRRVAPLGLAFGVAFRARWWLRLHRWLFRPGTYLGKARRLVESARRPTA